MIGSGPVLSVRPRNLITLVRKACLALREEGYEVVLVNSNPATIMTDTEIADRVYIEPLTVEFVSQILRKELPDAILPTIGGQIGLNLAMKLSNTGILDGLGIELLGTKLTAIDQAEDRGIVQNLMQKLHEPVPESAIANNIEEAQQFADKIGFRLSFDQPSPWAAPAAGLRTTKRNWQKLRKTASQPKPRDAGVG